ncbi:Lipoprotein [Shewanella aquimarina]
MKKLLTLPTIPLSLAAVLLMGGCTPTVKIEPPEKPIVINLNVKIEHEIKIKVDKELDELINNDELF